MSTSVKIRRISLCSSSSAIAAAVLIVAPVFAQDAKHAPTVAQCRADVAAWEEQSDATLVTKLSYGEVNRRSAEMFACRNVDPTKADDYNTEYAIYSIEFASRMMDFITRNKLTEKFKAEDAAGQR